MKIAIDATIIRKENTGTGFYIINLINGLAKIRDDNDYYIFMNKKFANEFFIFNFENNNFHIINKNFKNRIFRVIWQFFLFPFELKKLKIQVLHSPNYITPLFKLGFKVIVTIHDLTFYLFPEKFTITKRLLFKYMLPIFIRISDKIIAVSNNTKKDILKFFNVPENKIIVTFESYPEYYNNDNYDFDVENTLNKYKIKNKYLLFVGMIEPRKNILSILKSFKEVDSELNLDLVIVGKKGWYYKEIEEYVSELLKTGIKNNIIFTGYVSEPELKYLYKNAYIFIYPSIYEGFGLPPLQAMVCKVPVITSKLSSLPEVVGDSAILVNPYDIKEISNAIKILYNDLNKRSELINKGIIQAKKYNSQNFAQNTLKVYKAFNLN